MFAVEVDRTYVRASLRAYVPACASTGEVEPLGVESLIV
jgi:hypothetical protein